MHQLDSRHDITLDLVRRVAWAGEPLALAPQARQRIARRRDEFLALLKHDAGHGVYGVNQGQGEMIRYRMTEAQMERLARLKPFPAAVSFGDPYPERVTRAMVLARFANILHGHAAATPRLADALIDLLNHGPMPKVAATGQGGAGEILALYPLFADLSGKFDLEFAERGALINGAPCAAALAADTAIAARRRLALATEILALAIDAFDAPRGHYDAALGALWGGPHHEAAFAALNALLGPARDEQRDHQAPVSYRIIPAVLAQAHAAVAEAESTATIALASVSHNPTYLEPDADHPHGRVVSTGGFHNALAAPAIDAAAGASADLCLLAGRLVVGLLNGRASGFPDFLLDEREVGESDGHGALGYLPMAIAGFVEEARGHAQRTPIPAMDASVFGQDDVAAPAFLAWPKAVKAGEALDRSLAVLAVTASQALHLTRRAAATPPLRALLDTIRSTVPPVEADRVLGPGLQTLSETFTARVFDHA
ncbi:MAG TPA: aromatic amino acid lyase [Dongiaceae bacterium]|nr:aromatic amino acid lyase [Dongiaceae bacterium]